MCGTCPKPPHHHPSQHTAPAPPHTNEGEEAGPPGGHPPLPSAGHHTPWRTPICASLPTTLEECGSKNVATSRRNGVWQSSWKSSQLQRGKRGGVRWSGVEEDGTEPASSHRQHNWTQQCGVEQPQSNGHTATHHTPLHTPPVTKEDNFTQRTRGSQRALQSHVPQFRGKGMHVYEQDTKGGCGGSTSHTAVSARTDGLNASI